MNGFGMWGVVKETGIDDEGLAEFATTYFNGYPIYRDKSYSFYQALGDHKAFEIPTLWTIFTNFLGAFLRVGEKDIVWNLKGEGIVKGGIIIFDRNGNPKYAYEEETGVDVPVLDIVSALEAIKREA